MIPTLGTAVGVKENPIEPFKKPAGLGAGSLWESKDPAPKSSLWEDKQPAPQIPTLA